MSWDEFLAEADIISVHCPLKKETTGLFDKSAFDKMKNTCVFVNVSRGGTVDQDALLEVSAPLSIPIAPSHTMLETPLE